MTPTDPFASLTQAASDARVAMAALAPRMRELCAAFDALRRSVPQPPTAVERRAERRRLQRMLREGRRARRQAAAPTLTWQQLADGEFDAQWQRMAKLMREQGATVAWNLRTLL